MAAGRLPKPGTQCGPCTDVKCGHSDCQSTRAMAEFICHYCNQPIGYDNRFYAVGMGGGQAELVHAVCREEAIEAERKHECCCFEYIGDNENCPKHCARIITKDGKQIPAKVVYTVVKMEADHVAKS